MTDFDPKAIWPGWETVRVIGRGSYGAVYEIRRDVFGETERAALKVITIPQNSGDIDELYSEGYDKQSVTRTFHEHLKSIVAEYSLMRKLNGHSNVVNCDDLRYIQHEDGIGWDIYIRMELLTPLARALPRELSDEQVRRIGTDLCRALILCRKHNILHRDIKPANILVSENGDYKLGDFGIAKTVERAGSFTKAGTFEYMAPEVYNGERYGPAADLYSLGMVLYWLLNERRLPFLPLPPYAPSAAEKEQARLRRFAGEPLPAPAHGSKGLKAIVLKACAFDPKERYRTPEVMLHELQTLDWYGERRDFHDGTVMVDSAEDLSGGSFTLGEGTVTTEPTVDLHSERSFLVRRGSATGSTGKLLGSLGGGKPGRAGGETGGGKLLGSLSKGRGAESGTGESTLTGKLRGGSIPTEWDRTGTPETTFSDRETGEALRDGAGEPKPGRK